MYDGNIYPAETTSLLRRTTTKLNGTTSSSQSQPQPARVVQASDAKELQDPVINAVAALASETAKSGYGVLVFSGSRVRCEADALLISRTMPPLDTMDEALLGKRIDMMGDLRSLSIGIDQVLEQTIPFGVVFHRA